MQGQTSIYCVRGSNAEIIRLYAENGMANGETAARARQVARDNARLRHENAVLRGRVRELRRVNRAYRMEHLQALNYQFERREGWRMSARFRRETLFAACGIVAAITAAVCGWAAIL